MPRTYAEVFDIVRQFVRINVDDVNLVKLVKDAIDMAFYEIARGQRWPELLVLREPLALTGTSMGSLIPIPDHIGVEEVKYITPKRAWELVDKNRLVPPAPIYTKPRSYQIVGGIPETATNYQMALEPYMGIDEVDDTILFSYFRVPGLFSEMVGATLIVSSNWDDQVIKQAEHYVLTYLNKTEAADQIWKEVLGRMAQQPRQTDDAS